VSDPGAFREIARTVRIEYPIPYICVVLGALTLGCFALTAIMPAPIFWAACAICVLAGLGAIGLPFAALRQPDLLRSERHVLMSRVMDIMSDKGASETARSKAGEIVEGTLIAGFSGPRVPRPRSAAGEKPEMENDDG